LRPNRREWGWEVGVGNGSMEKEKKERRISFDEKKKKNPIIQLIEECVRRPPT
jgi:hypothetical protein